MLRLLGRYAGCIQPHNTAARAHLQRGRERALLSWRARLQHLLVRLGVLGSPEVRRVLQGRGENKESFSRMCTSFVSCTPTAAHLLCLQEMAASPAHTLLPNRLSSISGEQHSMGKREGGASSPAAHLRLAHGLHEHVLDHHRNVRAGEAIGALAQLVKLRLAGEGRWRGGGVGRERGGGSVGGWAGFVGEQQDVACKP